MNNPMKESLLGYMGKSAYLPQNKSELARGLRIPSQQRAGFRSLISELEKDGEIIRLKKGTYALKKPVRDLVSGKVKFLRSGKVLFIPDHPSELADQMGAGAEPVAELPVAPHRLASAMDGDKVAALVELAIPRGWKKRHKGRPVLDEMQVKIRIEKILERAKKQWVGAFRSGRAFGQVKGDGVSSPEWIELVERPRKEPQPGQLVVVEPVSWSEGRVPAKGRLVEILGWSDDAGVDIEVIIRKYQLPVQFSEEVLSEVEQLSDDLNKDELSSREDWSGEAVMSIDPEGARDFDDAIHVVKLAKGWRLAVHIADVSHYVKPGTALDREAMERGNSTYLPDRVLPMLPPRLSDDLCSLRAGEIRLTKVCVMDFNDKAERTHTRFADAYIRNERQMSYPEAYKLMTGKGTDGESVMLREAWSLASLLRKKRMSAGALDLDFPEVRVLLDDQGMPIKVVAEEYDESHQLIEEFMLAANEAVAETLKNANRPSIYRIHEEPDEAKLKEFGEQCKLYGHPVHDLTQRKNLSILLESIKGSPDEQLLKLALLRSMMRARYDTQPMGHYGLAKANYCHFTSPIRRYADLEVHRALAALSGKVKRGADVSKLQEIAEHISDTERVSADAERDAHRLKMFEWLSDQVHAEHPEVHDALVTEVRHFGIFVEIPRLQIKGLVKQANFSAGSWYYEGFAERWSNRNGERVSAGSKLKVVPVFVDREKQWVDFGMHDNSPSPKKHRRK